MLNKDKHIQICEEIHKLAVTKDKRYGSSVSKGFAKRGMNSILWRLEDKLNRLENIVDNPFEDNGDESLRDTLMDLAGYAILGILELDEVTPQQLSIYREAINNVKNNI